MEHRRVAKNAKWIIICKIFQSVLQLLIGMFCARYLGPSNYGLINYAASITAFAIPLMRLGLDATLVYELVKEPDKENEIIGTSLFMNLISGLLCAVGVTTFASITNFGETETIIVCALYSTSIVFAALEMIQYWYQYKLMSKYSSLAMLCVYFIVSAYKIFLLVTEKSVRWFALSHSVEYGLVAFSLLFIYFKNGGRLYFAKNRVGKMLSRSKHYILSSLMVRVIQNTDHIMITALISNAENGFYSAAVTCAAVAQFVYDAIIDSFRPMILENKKKDSSDYEKNISGLYSIVIYLSVLQGIVFFVFAPLIVNLLYGADYSETVSILRILIWYLSFSIMGTVRNIWLLAEEKQRYLWLINVLGAIFNIALNALLIPFIGACGAALASFSTQFFANFVLGFIFPPIRENNRLLLKGLNPKFASSEFKKLKLLFGK